MFGISLIWGKGQSSENCLIHGNELGDEEAMNFWSLSEGQQQYWWNPEEKEGASLRKAICMTPTLPHNYCQNTYGECQCNYFRIMWFTGIQLRCACQYPVLGDTGSTESFLWNWKCHLFLGYYSLTRYVICKYFLPFCGMFFHIFFFLAACGSSWARNWTCATVVACATKEPPVFHMLPFFSFYSCTYGIWKFLG